jgi:hypothetical protein
VTSTAQSVMPDVDLAALTDWMDSIGLESGPITGPRAIGGGTQNIMVRFTRGAREFVLRRGPAHLTPLCVRVRADALFQAHQRRS